MIKDEYTKVTVLMPKKLKAIILSEAKYEGRSMSNFILRLLIKHFNFELDEDE